MLLRLLFIIALLLPLPAAAQDGGNPLEGSWALELGGATIFRFDLERVPGKAGEWRGTWSRPSRFASDGDNFAQLQLPARQIRSMAGLELDGTGLAPYVLQRVAATTQLGPFREGATYARKAEAGPEPEPEPETQAATPPRPTAEREGPPDEADAFRLPPSGVVGR